MPAKDAPPPGFHWLDTPPQLPAGEPVPALPNETQNVDADQITHLLMGARGKVAGGLGTVLPQGMADFAADLAVPVSPTDIGVWLATLPFPEARAGGKLALKAGETVATKLLPFFGKGTARVLGPTIGGAIGGMTEEGGSTPFSGAERGAVSGLLGETFNKLAKLATYTPWVSRIAKQDAENVGKVVSDMVPEFGKIKTLKDFQSTFLHGYGQRKLSANFDAAQTAIADALQGAPVNSPTMLQYLKGSGIASDPRVIGNVKKQGLNIAVPFEVAMDKIKTLRNEANRLLSSAHGPQALEKFDAANQIEKEVIGGLPPELQAKYTDAKQMYARGQSLLRFFDEKSLLSNEGLDVERLQKKFRSEGLSASESTIAASEVAKFQEALFRGGDALTVDEMPKILEHLRGHKLGFGLSVPLEKLAEKSFVGSNLPRRGLEMPRALAPFLGGRTISSYDRPANTLAAPPDEEP